MGVRILGSALAACVTVAVTFALAPAAFAKPQYLGLWVVEQSATLPVAFPASDELGATLRVAPAGEAAVTAHTRAKIPFFANGFDRVRMKVAYELDPAKVHAWLTVDGQPAELLAGTGPQTRVVRLDQPGSTFGVEVQATDAPATGWSVQLQAIGFDRKGWTFWYSPDCAGLAGYADAEDRLRLGVDPDWGELAWPLQGSLTATRSPEAGVDTLAFTYAQNLPPAGLVVRASLDGMPLELFPPGPLSPAAYAWPDAQGKRVEFSVRAYDSLAADAAWVAVVDGLRVDPKSKPSSADAFQWEVWLPGDPTPTAPAATPAAPEGCTAGRKPLPSLVFLSLVLLAPGLILARRRVLRSPAPPGGSP